MKKLLFLLLIAFGSFAQTVVQDIANVKKPNEGKLYYAKKDKTLYLYRDSFVVISTPPAEPVIISPPVFPIGPNGEEITVGYWAVPDRILIAKAVAGQLHLMQTNASRTYYVTRGKNLLNHHETKVILVNLPNIVSQNSDLGGLYPSPNFPEAEFLKLGFSKNAQGEYIPK